MTMQDPDPMRERDLDPRLTDPRLDPNTRGGYAPSATWGWIAGLAVLVLLLVFLFGSGTQNVQTTDRGPASPTISTPAPMPPATTPRAPSETTGQGAPQQ
jgi:hypothetical protein